MTNRMILQHCSPKTEKTVIMEKIDSVNLTLMAV